MLGLLSQKLHLLYTRRTICDKPITEHKLFWGQVGLLSIIVTVCLIDTRERN